MAQSSAQLKPVAAEDSPFVSPAVFFASCSQTVVYELEPFLMAKSFTMVSGLPKHGKTYWAAWLASTLSRMKRVVLFVEEEGPNEITMERFAPHIGDELELHEGTLHIAHRKGFRLDDPRKVDALIAESLAVGASVIFLDPARSLHGRDENKASGADGIGDIIQVIMRIIREAKVAVVLVHHDRKQGKGRRGKSEDTGSSDDVSGSGAWVAAVDSLIQIRKAPKDEQREGEFRFYVENSESRRKTFDRKLAVLRFPANGKPGDMTYLVPEGKAAKLWREEVSRCLGPYPEIKTVDELREASGIGKNPCQSAIEYAERTKEVVRIEGKGGGVQRVPPRTSPQ